MKITAKKLTNLTGLNAAEANGILKFLTQIGEIPKPIKAPKPEGQRGKASNVYDIGNIEINLGEYLMKLENKLSEQNVEAAFEPEIEVEEYRINGKQVYTHQEMEDAVEIFEKGIGVDDSEQETIEQDFGELEPAYNADDYEDV